MMFSMIWLKGSHSKERNVHLFNTVQIRQIAEENLVVFRVLPCLAL